MKQLNIYSSEIVQLQERLKEFEGNAEAVINDVLHNFAGDRAQEEIRRLMPFSGKTWAGKRSPAKMSKSMMNVNQNLSVTVKTSKNYQYLYFPNDGTNTQRHIGNQQFFEKGGTAIKDEIIDRCIGKLINNFEKGT